MYIITRPFLILQQSSKHTHSPDASLKIWLMMFFLLSRGYNHAFWITKHSCHVSMINLALRSAKFNSRVKSTSQNGYLKKERWRAPEMVTDLKKTHSATCGNGELGRLRSIKLTKQPTKGACSKQGDTLAPFSIFQELSLAWCQISFITHSVSRVRKINKNI